MSLREDLNAALKKSMLAKDKERTAALRMLLSEVKKVEVDQRVEVDDTLFLSIVVKLIKQHEESSKEFSAAGRTDLADHENFEADVLRAFLPPQLSEAEVNDLISNAVRESGAAGMSDMGKVMAILKPQAAGKTDMGLLSKKVREALQKL